jgi:hypothetical protein
LEGVWTVDNSLKLLLFSPASCWLKRPGTTTVYQSHANSNVFIELENKCYINHVILHILQVSHYSHLKSENFPIWDIFYGCTMLGSQSQTCAACAACAPLSPLPGTWRGSPSPTMMDTILWEGQYIFVII